MGVLKLALLFMVSLMLVAAPALGQTGQGPLTDKENPLLIGKRDLNTDHSYTLDQEIALGRQLSLRVDRVKRFMDDPLVTEYVNRIGQNIVLHSDANLLPFTIKIIDADDIDVFALPGGYLYVNRGMLEAADSEAELAGVLAHLIGHVVARHELEQASKLNLIDNGLPRLFQEGFIPLALLKSSVGAEKEADQLGAQYLWASGYDPQALSHFLEKMQLKEEARPGTFSIFHHHFSATADRIAMATSLVARFPDRLNSEPDSIEFNAVKARLTARRAEMGLAVPFTPPVLKRR